jgi:hypothetical protein
VPLWGACVMLKRSLSTLSIAAGLWLLGAAAVCADCDQTTQDLGTRAGAAYNNTIAHADAAPVRTALTQLRRAESAYAVCENSAPDSTKATWGYPHGEILIELGILTYVLARDTNDVDDSIAQDALHAMGYGVYEFNTYGPQVSDRNLAEERGYVSDAANFNDEIRIHGIVPRPTAQTFALNPDLDPSVAQPATQAYVTTHPVVRSLNDVCPSDRALNARVARLAALMPLRRYTGFTAGGFAIALEPCNDHTGIKSAALLLLADLEYDDDCATQQNGELLQDDRNVLKLDLASLDDAKTSGALSPALAAWLDTAQNQEDTNLAQPGSPPPGSFLAAIYGGASSEGQDFVEESREIMGW